MKCLLKMSLVVVAIMAVGVSSVNAEFIENFDSLSLGSVTGQNGWTDQATTTDATVSTDQASSPLNSLKVQAGDLANHAVDSVIGGQATFSTMLYAPASSLDLTGGRQQIFLRDATDGAIVLRMIVQQPFPLAQKHLGIGGY